MCEILNKIASTEFNIQRCNEKIETLKKRLKEVQLSNWSIQVKNAKLSEIQAYIDSFQRSISLERFALLKLKEDWEVAKRIA